MDAGDNQTFIDEDVDFDFLLEEDEETQGGRFGTGRFPSLRPQPKGPYKPARLRVHPNWGRIGAALLVLVVVVAVLLLTVKAIVNSRRDAAYRNYFKSVSALALKSHNQGEELDDLLTQPTGADRAQLIARVERLGGRAQQLAADARKLDVPDALRPANSKLVETFEYRHIGFVSLQQALTGAIKENDKKAAALAVAKANWPFVASDVVYSDSYTPTAKDVLREEGVDGVTVPDSAFVVSPEEFTSAKNAQFMLNRWRVGATTGKKKDGKVPPGLHGTSLAGVTMQPSGTPLEPGAGVVEVKASEDLAFEVMVENGGDGQEVQIEATAKLSGENSEPQKFTGVLDSIDPAAQKPVTISVDETPTLGETQSVEICIAPVPGEKIETNNCATYELRFTL
jgi:hypothetical protein